MADFNAGWGDVSFLRADFSGPRKKKKSISQRKTVQETGDLPFCSVPGSFFATGLVADNQSFFRSRQHRKTGSKHLLPALAYSHRNQRTLFLMPCFRPRHWTTLPSWSNCRIIRMNKMESLTSLAQQGRWHLHPLKVPLLIFQ